MFIETPSRLSRRFRMAPPVQEDQEAPKGKKQGKQDVSSKTTSRFHITPAGMPEGVRK